MMSRRTAIAPQLVLHHHSTMQLSPYGWRNIGADRRKIQSPSWSPAWHAVSETPLMVQEKRDAARAEHNPARDRFLNCKALYDRKVSPHAESRPPDHVM